MERVEFLKIGQLETLVRFEVEDSEFLAYLAFIGVLNYKILDEYKTDLPKNLVGLIIPHDEKLGIAAIYYKEKTS